MNLRLRDKIFYLQWPIHNRGVGSDKKFYPRKRNLRHGNVHRGMDLPCWDMTFGMPELKRSLSLNRGQQVLSKARRKGRE